MLKLTNKNYEDDLTLVKLFVEEYIWKAHLNHILVCEAREEVKDIFKTEEALAKKQLARFKEKRETMKAMNIIQRLTYKKGDIFKDRAEAQSFFASQSLTILEVKG